MNPERIVELTTGPVFTWWVKHIIEANPDVEVQMRGGRFAARARMLSDQEREAVWDDVRRAIAQIRVCEKRTGRNIRGFRLSRCR